MEQKNRGRTGNIRKERGSKKMEVESVPGDTNRNELTVCPAREFIAFRENASRIGKRKGGHFP